MLEDTNPVQKHLVHDQLQLGLKQCYSAAFSLSSKTLFTRFSSIFIPPPPAWK